MMSDDALLNDDDLLDETALFDDELLDDDLLEDENKSSESPEVKNANTSSKNTSHEEGQIFDSPEKPSEPANSKREWSSVDEIALDNEPLDYDDDLYDLDERRESKFTSERESKPTNISDILPQQKTAKHQDEETATKPEANRGRGGYRGRYNNRGPYRGRAGFRNTAPYSFSGTPDQLAMFNNGPVGGFPNPMGMGALSVPPGSFALPFNPNVPPPVLPSQLQEANWNRRVEAFVRKTAETGALPSRTRSYSGSSSCSTCSSGSRSRSRSPLPARRTDNRKDRRPRTPEKRKPVDDGKTARECAEAIGLGEDYLKKVEEQKRKREEIQRKKAEKFQDKEKTDEPETKRRRERSPVHSRERSADRDSRHRRKHHHRHRHYSRGHRSTSLEKLAQMALQNINEAVKPAAVPTSGFPNSVMLSNNNILPPMNVPPPPLPISSQASVAAAAPPTVPPQNYQTVQRPAIRTVSTTLVGGPDQPQVIMHTAPPDAKQKKLKARVVVVVSNVRTLQNALHRIRLFAVSVGDVKKVWQPSENDINIIFEKLDDAKKFLTQYHKFSISSVQLMLSLHKMYLNLDALP